MGVRYTELHSGYGTADSFAMSTASSPKSRRAQASSAKRSNQPAAHDDQLDRPKVPSPAVARASRVLDLVAAQPGTLSLADLTERLGLAKSSVHALTTTLTTLGLLVKDAGQTFVIGPHVMRWASAFSRRSDIATEFARIWDEGTARLQGATITLSILEDNDVLYIGARNSSNTPWFNFRVGMRLPMAFTATGHAFMSHMTDAEIRYRLRDGLPAAMTERSPTSVEDILGLVKLTRERGYALDDEYVSDGMVCFGASVLGAANRPVAGVAVSLPASERSPASDDRVVSTLLRMSQTISMRLGAEIEVGPG